MWDSCQKHTSHGLVSPISRKHQTNQTVTDSLQKDWAVLLKGVKIVHNAETLSNDHRSERIVTQ